MLVDKVSRHLAVSKKGFSGDNRTSPEAKPCEENLAMHTLEYKWKKPSHLSFSLTKTIPVETKITDL